MATLRLPQNRPLPGPDPALSAQGEGGGVPELPGSRVVVVDDDDGARMKVMEVMAPFGPQVPRA
jgi:hypothetical protein